MNTANCPQCGSELPPDAPAGVCPKCVFDLGFEAKSEPTAATVQHQSPPGRFQAPSCRQLEKTFPELEVLEMLGQGGMGAVYKARQKALDRVVALKVLPPEVRQDPSFAERFTREARTLGKLTHPNIVMIFEFGEREGLYYFVMEYVDGVNLRQTLRAGRLSPPEALAIVPQICDALQYAHDEGIVHRDIKPENVLLDQRGRVKIADFGLAKLLGQSAPDWTLTGSRQVMGTPHYMAPEQMEAPTEVDHRADIYSLGVVFYELLTGELPLGRFAVPSAKGRFDPQLDDVVMRTLEKEPGRRYQKASDIKSAVEAIRDSKPPQDAEVVRQIASASVQHKTRPLRVPFTITTVHGGFAEADGVISFDGHEMTIQFQVRDSIVGVASSALKNVRLSLDDIISIDLRQGWFSRKLELQCDLMSEASRIPDTRRGRSVFQIAKQDFDHALRLVDALRRCLEGEPWERVIQSVGHASDLRSATSLTSTTQADLERARDLVRGPATALTLLGVGNIVLSLLLLATALVLMPASSSLQNSPDRTAPVRVSKTVGVAAAQTGLLWAQAAEAHAEGPSDAAEYASSIETRMSIFALLMFVPLLLSLPVGGVQLFAASRMRRLDTYPLAIIGSVLTILPCHLLWLFGLPIGIWSLATIAQRHVRQAFDVSGISQPVVAKEPPPKVGEQKSWLGFHDTPEGPQNSSSTAVVAWVVGIFAVLFVGMVVCVALYFFSHSPVESQPRIQGQQRFTLEEDSGTRQVLTTSGEAGD